MAFSFALSLGVVGALLLASSPANAATRTWTGLGLTNNWNDAGNWLGALVPGAADVATFDGTGSKSATINVAINVAGINVTAGYIGTITQAPGIPMTVGASGYAQSGATFVGGTSSMTVNGPMTLSGGSLTTTAGTLTVSGAVTVTGGTFAAPGGTMTFSGGGGATIDTSGLVTLNNATFTGTKTIAAGTTLTVAGTLSLTSGALNGTGTLAAQGAINQASTAAAGTASLLINGTGSQTLTGASTTTAGNLPPLTINKPSGTLSLAGTIRTSTGWTYLAGTVDPGGSTVVFAGGTISGSHGLNAVDFRATTTIAAGTTLTVAGTLSLTSGALNGTGTLAAQGAINQASTAAAGTASLLINGTGSQTLTGASTTTAGNLPPLTINKPSGTLSLAGTIRTSTGWTYLAGTVDPGGSTVVFAGGTISGSHGLNAVDFRATTTIAAGTTLTVAGTLSLTSGALNGTGTLAAQGAINQASTAAAGTASLLINGTGSQTLTGASTTTAGNLPPLTINKPSGTLSLAGTIRTSTGWTYLAGTVDPGSSTVVFAGGTISGSHGLNAVDFRATTTIAAGTTLTVAGTLSLTSGALNGTGTLAAQGAINQASTAAAGTASLLINGTGSQTLTGASTTTAGNLPPLTINKPSGTLSLAGTIRTSTGWTYLAGTVDPGSSTVVFAGGTVGSAGMAFFDVIANGGTTTLGTAMMVLHDLSVSAGTFTTSASNHALTVAGNLTVTGTLRENGSSVIVAGNVIDNGTIVQGTSTLTLNGSLGQTISGSASLPAFNLVIGDPAGVTLATDVVVTGTLTLTSGSFDLATRRLTISNPIAGTGTNLVTGASSSITVAGVAGGITLPTSVTLLNNLAVNNTTGLALSMDVTIGGTLALSGGPVNVASATIHVTPTGTVTRTTGRVVGKLGKAIGLGSGVAVTFEIGDVLRYAPVALLFGSVTATGEVVASTTPADHPDIANSGLAPSRSVNRWWTVANAGLVFTTYDATFTFVPADVDVGATPALFVVGKRDGTTWTMTTPGTRTATTTQATGLTSFSEFAIGEPTANLAVSVTDGLATVVAGDGLTHAYTITVANGGPSDATAVTLTDNWPAGFVQGTISPTQGSCSPVGAGPDFTCALGTIAAGASATVSVDYSVPASLGSGVQTETVSVASSVVDPDPTDDTATDTTTVVEQADLSVAKDDGQASVVAGDGVSHAYTITVSNAGPSDADNMVVVDVVPAAMTVGVPSAELAGDCTGSFGNMIRCTLPASLAVGATWTITVPYTVGAGAVPGAVTNTATTTSDENPSGDDGSDRTDIVGSANLAVSVTDGLATVVAGDGLTHAYTITVANGGPSDATAVTLTDNWPAGFVQGTISPTQGSCSPVGAGPDFTCALGTIAAGASATVSVDYSVPASLGSGVQTETVSVASSVVDPDPTDDTATDTTTVVAIEPSATAGAGGRAPETDSLLPGDVPASSAGAIAAFAMVVIAFGVLYLRWPATKQDGGARRRRSRPPRWHE